LKNTARLLEVKVAVLERVQLPPTYRSPLVAFRFNAPLLMLNDPGIPRLVLGRFNVVVFCTTTLAGIPEPAVVLLPVHSLLTP
jgi:hypothetical protein